MVLSMVALHKRQDLLDDCVTLLNSEWSRSKAARLHSLEKSCDGLPYSLVMIETNKSQEEKVAGYCRLAKVVNQSKAVFIESVVVPIDRRGQGLGRHLMDLAEEHARYHGYTQIYLTTKDKQGFYEHLGYKYCKPVNTLNAQALETCSCLLLTSTIFSENQPTACVKSTDTKVNRSLEEETNENDQCTSETSQDISATNEETCCTRIVSEDLLKSTGCMPLVSPPSAPPPPPPPPPPSKVPPIIVYWMMKDL